MKKIAAVLLVLVLAMSLSIPAMAGTGSTNGSATLYKTADSWYVSVPAAGTVTVSDNKVSYSYDVVAGDNFLGLQKGYTGSLRFDSFVEDQAPAPVEPAAPISIGLIGYNANRCSTSIAWITLYPGQMINWATVEADYAAWEAQGGLAPGAGWQSSGADSLSSSIHTPDWGYSDFTAAQLETCYNIFVLDPGYVPLAPVVEQPAPLDFTSLEAAIAKAESYLADTDFTGYTSDSISAAEAWVNAKLYELYSLRNWNEDQAGLDTAINQVNIDRNIAYANGLLVKIDFTSVNAALSAAQAFLDTDFSGYTPASIAAAQAWVNAKVAELNSLLRWTGTQANLETAVTSVNIAGNISYAQTLLVAA
jgi:predicted aspartyl protease